MSRSLPARLSWTSTSRTASAGHKSLNVAVQAGLVPSPMALIRMPSEGSHLYYEGDSQGNGSMPKHGLDLRGKGGYVVAPPSTVGGRPYVVVSHSAEPAFIEFAARGQHLAPQPQRPAWRPREGREPGVAHLATCPAAHLRCRLQLELVMGDEFSGKAGSRYRYRGNTIPGTLGSSTPCRRH
jgi:hypothetical protein